jgi:hypothetical protein
MTEPILSALGVKIVSGAVGGAVIMAIDMPQTRREWASRVVCALGGSYLFTGFALRLAGLPRDDVETTVAVAGLIGGFSYFVLGLVVRFFRNRGGKDIVDVGREVRDIIKGGGTENRP